MKKYKIIINADNNEKREKGLMFTNQINDDECAYFTFPRTADHSFWNKNVSYPLTLVFCNMDREVVAIKNMDAESTRACKADNANIKYVVEVSKGALDDVNIGDVLIIDNNGEELYFVNK